MKEILPALKKADPAYQQVETHLRRMIEQGEWGDGMRLPPFSKIASHLGTSIFTVQKAIKPLVKEGLVKCRTRMGTIVQKPFTRLRRVGAYLPMDVGDVKEWAFFRCLIGELRKCVEESGGRLETWMDHRPLDEQSEPLEDLVRSVKTGGIQGLATAAVGPQHIRWLNHLGIPVVGGSPEFKARVDYDFAQMARISVDWLISKGCRKMGMITNAPLVSEAFRCELQRMVATQKIEIRSEWIRSTTKDLGSMEMDPFGYRQFQEIWGGAERPDGLLVYPDTLINGVTMAILRQGIQMPGELRLIFHRNEEINIFCPVPAACVVSSVRQTAAALLQQLGTWVKGEKAGSVTLPFVLRANEELKTPS